MTQKKLLLKILAGIAGIILILFILLIGNSFMGNPISAMLAEKDIQNYIDRNYSSLNLELGEVNYNFKFGSYCARVTSKTSVDTHFFIEFRNKDNFYDSFDSDVLKKWNTSGRFEEIYSQEVKSILKNIELMENISPRVSIDHKNYDAYLNKLQLDMPFDKSIPLDYNLSITCEIKDTSPENLAKILKETHSELTKNDCIFQSYTLYINENTNILDVLPTQIESENLVESIKINMNSHKF